MAQAGVSLTKLYWNRSCSAGSTLLFLLQKLFFTLFALKLFFTLFALKLLVPLFIVSTGSVSRAHGQTMAIVRYASQGRITMPEPSTLDT